MDWTYNCSLSYPIGTKFVYSDLSFILLGEIVERVTGETLNVYTRRMMLEIGMKNSTYLPDLRELYRIAPTEYSGTDLSMQSLEKASSEESFTIRLRTCLGE